MNSAQAWSPDRVDEKFGSEAKGDGSAPLPFIETLMSEANLVGRGEIRSYLQGKGYSREAALTIMREMDMPDVKGVPYLWKGDLDDYLDTRKAAIREWQLERAAALKQHPWVWHVIRGPHSDD